MAIYDSDVYALAALNGYLAWDRRTRVVHRATTPQGLWAHLRRQAAIETPDVVLMGVEAQSTAPNLRRRVARLKSWQEGLHVVCLALQADATLAAAAATAGGDAYLLKSEVIQQIAWAVVHATNCDLVLSPSIAAACRHLSQPRIREATTLSERRVYPELSNRLRQALELCVVEGLPAHLAAEEMGVSLHTIRSYVKQGYRILEEQDETVFPIEMTPRERAFMRYTALVTT